MAIIYVRGPNPIWFFNNLTGQVLDDTYWAFFLTNDLPYVPQAVYQDPNGISPWANPMEFQPSGGLPNNLYFNPTQTYRIEIRQGPNQTDPLIWLVQNYVPGEGGSGGSTITDQLTVSANLITDPNFSDVFFNGSYTFTQASPGTYTVNVAPGWQLVLTGSGTTILTQGSFAGSSNTFGNPSYYLGINNTGWTSAILTQTLSNNGAIFANGAIAVAFTAQAVTTGQAVTVNYVPNGPSNTQTIVSAPVTTGGFAEYYGAIDLNASLNNNTDGAANVQIQFVLPGTGNVQLSNIQVVGQSTPLSVNFITPPSAIIPGSVPNYQELTYPQIVNAEFNVYRDSILYHPKDTLLTGWNFALNPWQFTTTTITNVAANQYTADQTIVIQQAYVTSATANNIAVGQASLANNNGYEVKAVTAHNNFAILQYIAPQTIRPYWGRKLSSLVRAAITTSHSSLVQFKMRLIYIAALPNAVAQNDPIATWVEGSDPVAASGYTLIAPMNDPIYTLTSTPTDFAFDQFQLPVATNANMTLGVLLYTISNMNQASTADIIVINDISLTQNDFAIASNPMTFDESLKRCQFYYEKSYDAGTLPGTAVATSQVGYNQGIQDVSGTWQMYAANLDLTYNTVKNKAPSVQVYSPSTGGAGSIDAYITFHGATGSSATVTFGTYWTQTSNGTKNTQYDQGADSYIINVGAGGNANAYGHIYLHYIADSRLGI